MWIKEPNNDKLCKELSLRVIATYTLFNDDELKAVHSRRVDKYEDITATSDTCKVLVLQNPHLRIYYKFGCILITDMRKFLNMSFSEVERFSNTMCFAMTSKHFAKSDIERISSLYLNIFKSLTRSVANG